MFIVYRKSLELVQLVQSEVMPKLRPVDSELAALSDETQAMLYVLSR